MRRTFLELIAVMPLASTAVVQGQVLAVQSAAFGLPVGQFPAPNAPGGGVLVGNMLYTGDAAQGFRHWTPADPNNPDPVNTGVLVFDTNTSFSLGGGGLCIPFCKVGQMAYDGNRTVYLTAYDQPKGQPFSATFPGVWRISVSPQGSPQLDQLLAPKFGLAGNLPTSIALGPDGNLKRSHATAADSGTSRQADFQISRNQAKRIPKTEGRWRSSRPVSPFLNRRLRRGETIGTVVSSPG